MQDFPLALAERLRIARRHRAAQTLQGEEQDRAEGLGGELATGIQVQPLAGERHRALQAVAAEHRHLHAIDLAEVADPTDDAVGHALGILRGALRPEERLVQFEDVPGDRTVQKIGVALLGAAPFGPVAMDEEQLVDQFVLVGAGEQAADDHPVEAQACGELHHLAADRLGGSGLAQPGDAVE